MAADQDLEGRTGHDPKGTFQPRSLGLRGGAATRSLHTNSAQNSGALLERQAAARGVAFILEWRVARVAALGRRG